MTILSQFGAAAIPTFYEERLPKKPFMDFIANRYQSGKITQVEMAMLVSWYVHYDETRRSGERYFDHVWRVAHPEQFHPHLGIATTEGGIIRGLLHDAIEKKFINPDDNWTLHDLYALGFDDVHVEDIGCLTKPDGALYIDYGVSITPNRRCLETKVTDSTDNRTGAKPERGQLYGIMIPYHLAVLNQAIKPLSDIVMFSKEIGTFNEDIFRRHSSFLPPQAPALTI